MIDVATGLYTKWAAAPGGGGQTDLPYFSAMTNRAY